MLFSLTCERGSDAEYSLGAAVGLSGAPTAQPTAQPTCVGPFNLSLPPFVVLRTSQTCWRVGTHA